MEEQESKEQAELINQEIQQMQQQLNFIKQEYTELAAVSESLKNLEETTEGSEMLMPIGGGIFIKTSIKDSENILMNIGSNVVVNKSLNETNGIIENQLKELKNAAESLENEIANIIIMVRGK